MPPQAAAQQSPDFIADESPDFIADGQAHATAPAVQPSAMQRFRSGAKAGMGGENALNTPVDPEHPISSNPMVPGAGVYRDIRDKNYAGAAGRVLGPAAELAVMIGGGRGAGEEMPAVESSAPQPSVLGTRVKAVGKVAAQDAASRVPVAGRLVRRPSIGDYWKAVTAKPATMTGEVAPPSTDQVPGRPYVPRPRAASPYAPAEPIPSRPGLMLPGEVAPPAQAPAQPPVSPVTRKQVGAAVDKSFGVEPLKPNVRLRDQVPAKASPKAEPVSENKVESSVIHSHDYDPAAKELHIVTKSNPNTAYVYGDVSPDQAQAFESATSKGKAWAEFKKGGSPLVAKIVNGNRVPVRPVIAAKDLNPEGAGPKVQVKATARPGRAQVPTEDDLVPLLKKSVKQARSKRSTAAD